MKLNREKYTWAELILTLLFFGYFISLTFQSEGENSISIYMEIVILYTAAIIIMTLVTMMITKSKKIGTDERDKAIETKANRNAYVSVLSVINVLLIALLFAEQLLQPTVIFSILFATLFLAHIVHLGTRVYYYKAGI